MLLITEDDENVGVRKFGGHARLEIHIDRNGSQSLEYFLLDREEAFALAAAIRSIAKTLPDPATDDPATD